MLTLMQAPSPSRSKSSRTGLRTLLAGSALALIASTSNAAIIDAISGGEGHDFSPVNVFGSTANPENGTTFQSTNGDSVYGYTNSYGLAGNGSWNGGSYIGLNSSGNGQYMTLSFDDPVAAVTAFVNYAPGYGTPYIAVFDTANQLIESLNLSILTPNGYNAGETTGFMESSNIIKSIRFGGAYIVASNITTAAAVVPIPSTVLLMGLGLGLLVFSLRREAGAGQPSFSTALAS